MKCFTRRVPWIKHDHLWGKTTFPCCFEHIPEIFILCDSITFVVYAKINGKHVFSIGPHQTDQTQSPYRTFVLSRIMKANPFDLWSSRFVQNRVICYQVATFHINISLNIVPKKLLWVLHIDEFFPPSIVRILLWIGSSSFSKGSIFWRFNDKLYEWLKSKPFHNLLQSTLLNNSIRIFVQWLVACFLFWDWKRCGGDWGFEGSFLTYSWGRAPDRNGKVLQGLNTPTCRSISKKSLTSIS